MKNKEACFTSNSDEWETPQNLFDALDLEFNFEMDVCATAENSKCDQYWNKAQDGTSQQWSRSNWCNPPYSNIGAWVARARTVSVFYPGTTTVLLLPSRTDTRWFHNYLYKMPGVELRFIKGRLKFSESKNCAPFPSMIAVVRN